MNGYRQVLVRFGIVAVDLDVECFPRGLAQVGQGADDTELGFLMIGRWPEDQVNELRSSRGKSLAHVGTKIRQGVRMQKRPLA
ncbi:hypothetical protein D9M71_473960 [compost metagenome]